jgi:hypothetical protein
MTIWALAQVQRLREAKAVERAAAAAGPGRRCDCGNMLSVCSLSARLRLY